MNDKYTYSHVIKSIQNIREDGKVNKYHKLITGLRCNNVEYLRVGCMGSLIIEPYWINPTPSWFYTTVIESISKRITDGTVVVRTKNSVYTFVPIQGGESDDLSGQCGDDTD